MAAAENDAGSGTGTRHPAQGAGEEGELRTTLQAGDTRDSRAGTEAGASTGVPPGTVVPATGIQEDAVIADHPDGPGVGGD